jgi:hypothetical protein
MTKRILTGLFAILAICVSALASGEERLSIVTIPIASREAIDRLQEQVSLDFIEIRDHSVTAAVNPDELKLLGSNGIGYDVLYSDANDLIREVRPTGGVGAYHTYASVIKELDEWAAQMPTVASVHTIGTSVEGRAIPALKIEAPGQVPSAERPKVLLMGLHHAREWISVEVPMALIKRLLTGYQNDAQVRDLLAARTLWIVPVVNPDGLEFSQQKFTMWRKNRHKTWSLPFTNGVDPNRNYGFEWKGSGSSPLPFSEVYRGPEPFSEPEIQAIKALAEAEHFTASISFHSYSELVLYPWGHTHKPCPDNDLFKRVAGELAAINHYTPQTGSDLYVVNGECDDWLYGTLGTIAFTIELGQSFIPRDSQIPSITGPNVEATLHLIKNADSLRSQPLVTLNLIERLAGAPGSPEGPWSPGRGDEALRRRVLEWASRELGGRLAEELEGGKSETLSVALERLARYGVAAPGDLVGAMRGVRAALVERGETRAAAALGRTLQATRTALR